MDKEEEELFDLIKKANSKPILSEVMERVKLELGAFCKKILWSEILLLLKRRVVIINIANLSSGDCILLQHNGFVLESQGERDKVISYEEVVDFIAYSNNGIDLISAIIPNIKMQAGRIAEEALKPPVTTR